MSQMLVVERLIPDNDYLARRSLHLLIERSGADCRLKISDSTLVSGYKPAVNIMFSSLANSAALDMIAVVLNWCSRFVFASS